MSQKTWPRPTKYKIPFIYEPTTNRSKLLEYPATYLLGNPGFQWRENYVFYAGLQYVRYAKGRSAVRFHFKDVGSEDQYSMSISEFEVILPDLINGKVWGYWTFVKQGANYGLASVQKVNKDGYETDELA